MDSMSRAQTIEQVQNLACTYLPLQHTQQHTQETVQAADDSPSANDVGQESTKRSRPEVHHSEDSCQVGSLVCGEAKLGSQVWCQGVVYGQLHTSKSTVAFVHGTPRMHQQCKIGVKLCGRGCNTH